jgi:hypothetical protein
LDFVAALCKHPALGIHKFPNGETSYHCQRCAKTWPCLQDAIDEAEQTEPIHATEGSNAVIPEAITQMANEMSYRLGQTVAELVAATNPGTAVAMGDYQDFASMGDMAGSAVVTAYDSAFRNNLRAQTPFVRPLPVQSGRQMGEVFVNTVEPDPAMRNAAAQLRLAQHEANQAMARRHKAMEDAARAAAAAFDQGLLDEAAPVKLEGARKLKVVS